MDFSWHVSRTTRLLSAILPSGVFMERNNVIELPNRSRLLTIKNKLRLRFDLEQKRILISASILSILFLVAAVNDRLVSNNTQMVSGLNPWRDLASAQSTYDSSLVTPNYDWESRLALELATENPADRNATLGQRPSALDQLQFGTLAGNYSLKIYHNRINEISFAASDRTPTLIGDRERFLLQTRDFLAQDFASVKRLDSRYQHGQVVESYSLINKAGESAAQVEFRLDAFGRLLSMKINESSAVTR